MKTCIRENRNHFNCLKSQLLLPFFKMQIVECSQPSIDIYIQGVTYLINACCRLILHFIKNKPDVLHLWLYMLINV